MKAYLLAAGFATRMYPLTRHCAKPLLEVAGAPILSHILARVEALPDLSEIVVVGNHRFADSMQAWSRSVSCRVPLTLLDDGVSEPDQRLGAVGDLAFALDQIPPHGEDWLVVAGDNLLGFDLLPIYRLFGQEKKPLLIVRRNEHGPGPSSYNEVTLDASGRVLRFREKPDDPVSPLSAIALYFLPAGGETLLQQYLADGGNPDAPGFFMSWLVSVRPVAACPVPGAWFDIGSLESLEEARANFRR